MAEKRRAAGTNFLNEAATFKQRTVKAIALRLVKQQTQTKFFSF